jgi:hypothetical protein
MRSSLTRPRVAGYVTRKRTMPKQAVVQYECERCPAIWYAPNEDETAELILEFKLPDEPVQAVRFSVLCPSCSEAVKSYVSQICKELQKTSSRRAKKEEAEAPSPVTRAAVPGSQPAAGDRST